MGWRSLITAAALSSAALFASVPCDAQVKPPYVAVFASEKLMGEWIGSWFRSMGGTGAGPNECELAISERLSQGGLALPGLAIAGQKIEEARKFHIVFSRYGDLSTLPNDTAVRAARILDASAVASIVCGVRAQAKKGAPGSICANIGCKAVDMKSRRRIAAEGGQICAQGADEMAASVAAIRDVCAQAGDSLAAKLAQRY